MPENIPSSGFNYYYKYTLYGPGPQDYCRWSLYGCPMGSVISLPCRQISDHRLIESQNHRVVRIGRVLTDHLVPTPCHGQGHLPPDQVAQSPVQPGLEHFQGAGSHSFSGQPGPGPHHPHNKEFLSYI